MSERPKISPAVIGAITDAAPGRLIRKLDKDPARAEAWEWSASDNVTTVQTNGDAVVTLKGPLISDTDSAFCDCLLSPKCLHLLSVVTRLELSLNTDAPSTADELPDDGLNDVDQSTVLVTEPMRLAATELHNATAKILASGASAASIVAQGKVLTALHLSRLCGLHRASGAATRLIKGVRALKEGDTNQYAAVQTSLLEVLESCNDVIASDSLPLSAVGVARRRYSDVGTLNLSGVVTTRIGGVGGYGGCVTYLLGADGQFSTVSTVVPRDMGGPNQAWKTSVQIGDITASHEVLCRQQVFIQNGTRSEDGRLGSGKKVKAAVGNPADITAGAIARWFEEPLQSQLDRVYTLADVPYLQRPPGWDFVTFEAVVLGSVEDGVVLSVGEDLAIRGVGDDSRGNLSRLGKMVGSKFRFVARVDIEGLRTVTLLTIFYDDDDDMSQSVQLELEHFQIERDRKDVELVFAERPRPWGCYERAFERAMLGGWRTFPAHGRVEGTRDQKRLTGFGMYHGAKRLGILLDASQRVAGVPPDAVVFANAWRHGLEYQSLFLRALSLSEWNYRDS